MKAFHDDHSIKEKYLARVKAHREADNLIRGTGWEDGKGCAIGCTLESYDHSRYPIEIGIPTWLAYLEDKMFECLPLDEAMHWPERFLDAINVGSDLDKIKRPFLIFMLESVLEKFDHEKFHNVKISVEEVITLLSDPISTVEDFISARNTADAAAAAASYAARAAAYAADAAAAAYAEDDAAYAARAAYAAANAAAYAAADYPAAYAAAAYAATAYAAAYAVAADEYIKLADKLIELIKETK